MLNARSLSLAALLTAAFLLVGCGGSDDPSPPVPPPPPAAFSPPPEPPTEPPPPPPSSDRYLLVQRTLSGSSSLECYTFYSDGSVELRHSGLPDVTDSGQLSGTLEAGEIDWDSGRSSNVEWDGAKYRIAGVQAAEIETCVA